MLGRDIVLFAKPFQSVENGEVFAEYGKYKQKTIGRIRDDDIGKNDVSVLTTVTHHPRDTEIIDILFLIMEIDDGTTVIVVNMTVSTAATDGAGFQFGEESAYEGIKKRYG